MVYAFSLFTQQRFTGKIKIFCDKGINNNEDYFNKHHPPAHHQHMRPWFILKAHIVRKIKKWTVSNFKNLDRERVCSLSDYAPRPFSPFRPFSTDFVPRPFRPIIPLYDVTSIDYLTSQGRMIMDSLFIPVTDNSCIPRTPWGQTLMDSTSITFADR